MTTRNIIIAAGAILLSACTQTEVDPSGGVLTARLEQTEPETRASFDDVDGKMAWTAGDKVAVYVGNAYQEAEITPSNGHLAVSETSISFRKHYAVYPSSVADASNYGNPTLKVILPSSYDITDIVAGSKTSDFSPVPMVAVNNTLNSVLFFRHVGGLLRVRCNNVPAGTKSLKVTVDGGITGAFEVASPSSDNPTITSVAATAGNSSVVFVVSAEGLAESTNGIILNVPVPCGTYSNYRLQAFSTGDGTGEALSAMQEVEESHTFARHHGWKLPFAGVEFVLQHTGATVTLDDGTVVQEVVRDKDTSGATNTAPFDSYRTTDGGATKEDVSVTYEYAEADADGLPARTGGDIVWSSAKPSTLSSVTASGSSARTFSARVAAYSSGIVKEVDSEFLKHAENLKSRTAVGSSSSPHDLSMYDIHGTSRGNRPVTANSYVVDRAGWYMFPLVYGNAIDYTKSGATLYNNGVNAYAYKDAASPAANTNTNWHNFQRFTGSGQISSPYVLDDCGALLSFMVEAVVMWQDVESATYSFIENVAVTNISSSNIFYDPKTSAYKTSVPYIKFQVPMGEIDSDETKDPLQRVTGIRQGNAVIALRLKSARTIHGTEYAAGTILWSWHIWITDGFDTDGDYKGDGLVSIPVTNYQNATFNMMPANLGWCDTKTTTFYKDRVWYVRVSQTSGTAEPIVFRVVQKKAPASTGGSGTYYQWGRKDPFIPSNGSGNKNKAAYSPAGYTLTADFWNDKVSNSTSTAANASMAIQNPYTHYVNLINEGWMSSPVAPYNLWNMENATSTADVTVSKTVYDPCPPGYCVPQRIAFTGFTTTGLGSTTLSQLNVEDRNGDGAITSADFEKGWYFYTNSLKTRTIFFPIPGRRSISNSALVNVGEDGSFWSAAPAGNGGLYFMISTVGTAFVVSGRSLGGVVRPVQESHVGTGISAGGQQTTDYNFNGSNGQ